MAVHIRVSYEGDGIPLGWGWMINCMDTLLGKVFLPPERNLWNPCTCKCTCTHSIFTYTYYTQEQIAQTGGPTGIHFQCALRDPHSNLTYTAVTGARKQSVMDAERLFTLTLSHRIRGKKRLCCGGQLHSCSIELETRMWWEKTKWATMLSVQLHVRTELHYRRSDAMALPLWF